MSVCLDTVAVWIARTGHRRALRELAEEGRLLSDIGLTREQALREAGKPFWRRSLQQEENNHVRSNRFRFPLQHFCSHCTTDPHA